MLLPLFGCEGESSDNDNAEGPDFNSSDVSFDEPEFDVPEVEFDSSEPVEIPGGNPNSTPSNSNPVTNGANQETVGQEDTCTQIARASNNNAGVACSGSPVSAENDPFADF